eukprot:Gregarina_sp_Poly_1__1369@NODE_133_length_13228_cov_89_141783_g119_i0_p4_GENE_NODE_133_length_13228_cov_89_141783_g119_i0NODE_133_length_13228_cov_89_141783_g119_i0_p4_ORF_typecomplete_len334_score36_07UPF0121/PF03661_13/2_9e21DUF1673/PF07895_11/1_7DUF1673/PF07895_11/45_NODE_133_length_13228_cov_89_141783_g119_i0917710178
MTRLSLGKLGGKKALCETDNMVSTKFEDFDWVNNAKWQSYFENLYPTPSVDKIIHFKRKWYKKEIDPDFDFSTIPDQTAEKSEMPTAGRQSPTEPHFRTQQSPPGMPPRSGPAPMNSLERISTVLLSLAIILSAGAFLPVPLAGRLRLASISLYIFGFLASICATLGLPKLQAVYWEQVFYSDAGQAVMMTFLALIITQQVLIISPALSGLIIAAEGLSRLNLHPKILEWSQRVRNTKYLLMQAKADIEVFVGIFIFVFGLAGRLNFLSGFMYWNVLRTKYTVNGFTRTTFSKFDTKIRNVLRNPICPRIVYAIYDKFAHTLKRFGDAGTNTQ